MIYVWVLMQGGLQTLKKNHLTKDMLVSRKVTNGKKLQTCNLQ